MMDDRLVAIELAKLAIAAAPPLNEEQLFAIYRRCLTVIRRSARRSRRPKESGASSVTKDGVRDQLRKLLANGLPSAGQ